MHASPRGTLACWLSLLALALALAPGRADAQSLGLEAGLAGVENYDPVTPSLGVSLFMPLTDRFKGVLSYSRWTGCDHGECEEPRTGYGNQGLNVLGLFRVLGSQYGLNTSVGAGLGWYERLRLENGSSDSYYDEAMTFSTELRLPVALNSSVYLRADMSIPSDDHMPRWGFLRIGADVGRF